MHTIQKQILAKLKFYNSGARFSNLRINNIENDKFNYHLQKLIEEKYLTKRVSRYFLAPKGKSFVTNLQEDDIQMKTTYKLSVYIVPIVNGKVLLYKRLKHPQYGYVGYISEKMKFGENMVNAAIRGIKEETTLDANFSLVGNLRQIRKNSNGKVIEDGIFYIMYTDKVTGKLREKCEEGEYFWIDIDKISSIKKLFKPSVEIVSKEIQNRIKNNTLCKEYFIYELEPKPEKY